MRPNRVIATSKKVDVLQTCKSIVCRNVFRVFCRVGGDCCSVASNGRRGTYNVIVRYYDAKPWSIDGVVCSWEAGANITVEEVAAGAPASPLPINPGGKISPEHQLFARQVTRYPRSQGPQNGPKRDHRWQVAPRVVPIVNHPSSNGDDACSARIVVVKWDAQTTQGMAKNPEWTFRTQFREEDLRCVLI